MTNAWPSEKIILKPTKSLIPYARNSRVHSADQIKKIQASIREYGFTIPVLIDEKDTIIAGHGRVMAAQAEQIENVPCVVAIGWSDAKKRAYVIADNKLTDMSKFDEEILVNELADLINEGFDATLTGFDDKELKRLLKKNGVHATGEDDLPDIPLAPVSTQGDVWVLGVHRVMCGDSTSAESVEKLMNGRMADILITDPPYNVDYEGKTAAKLKIDNDKKEDQAFLDFLTRAFRNAFSSMRDGAAYYIWHADSEGFNFRGAVKNCGVSVRQCLIWLKSTMVMGRQDYHWKHEPCLYGWKEGAAHTWVSDRKQTTILEFDKPVRNGEHPTMKPVSLIEYQMLNNTVTGDILLDLFGGSGTAVIAAEKNERAAYVMEIDPVYCDVIVKRWQSFTGKSAILDGTKKTYQEMHSERSA